MTIIQTKILRKNSKVHTKNLTFVIKDCRSEVVKKLDFYSNQNKKKIVKIIFIF